MSYKLFLDDERQPAACVAYMSPRIGDQVKLYLEEWVVVKHYHQFITHIQENGLPELISFDHDLSEGHYHKNFQDGVINYDSEDFNKNYFKTGFHCARWLLEYCNDNGLQVPPYIVHSMNPVGTENIKNLLK